MRQRRKKKNPITISRIQRNIIIYAEHSRNSNWGNEKNEEAAYTQSTNNIQNNSVTHTLA